MNEKELIKALKECGKDTDREAAHVHADKFLLEFISDKKVSTAFDKIEKWYA